MKIELFNRTAPTGPAILLLAPLLASCVSAANPWAGVDRQEALERARAEPGRICPVRIESAHDGSVEIAYQAGPTRMNLGVLEPDEGIDFAVPCSAERITVYTVMKRKPPDRDLWVRPREHELNLLDLTRIIIREAIGRSVAG